MGRLAEMGLDSRGFTASSGRGVHRWLSADGAIGVALAVAVWGVYSQVAGFEFLNYDDDVYVVSSDVVRGGLGLEGVRAAFTDIHAANWHPVTTISHMLDWSLFGMWAGGHHLGNVLFHAMNSVGLFLLLRAMTRERWRSAFVAAIFALHPLRVESVAWVAERKDVLSTAFSLLTLAAYWRYVRQPSRRHYGLVVGVYSLALLSKPMVVTLPLLMLLLDVWPLQRWRGWSKERDRDAGRSATRRKPASAGAVQGLVPPPAAALSTLVWEKLPLCALAGIVSLVTVRVQTSGGAVVPLDILPVSVRLANVPLAYARYLWKTVWPADLSILYPYVSVWSAWSVGGASVALAAVTLWFVWLGPCHRYALVGWLWFLVGLFPVIGIFQAGVQAIADRYMYVPMIGLLLIVAWGMPALVGNRRAARCALVVVGVVLILTCLPLTWAQVGRWRNSYTVFEHALAVTEDNAVAHEHLGKALLDDGRLTAAATHFEYQVRLAPYILEGHLYLSALLEELGHDEAAARATEARRLVPKTVAGDYYNRGNVEMRRERFERAAWYYRMARILSPEWPELRHNLGIAFASLGRPQDALAEYDEALRLRSDFVEVYVSRGLLLADNARMDEAMAAFRAAIALRPDYAGAYRGAGLALARHGRSGEARGYLETALRLAPDDAEAGAALTRLPPGH